MFYAPHAIFKVWEGGKIKNIIAGLNTFILDKKERTKKERILADYFVESLNSHNLWALKMLFIEFLNLVTKVVTVPVEKSIDGPVWRFRPLLYGCPN